MKRKLLAMLLALCMVLTLLPVAVFAGVEDAKELPTDSDGDGYIHITESGTYTLSADVSDAIVVDAGVEAVLDLNGHKIQTTTDYYAITNRGTLTIQDTAGNGSVVVETANGAIGADDNSVTTIVSGTFTSKESAVSVRGVGATVYIKGGTFTATDAAVISGTGRVREGNGNVVNITDGVFNGSIETKGAIARGIYSPWKDTFNVSGGTFNITDGAGVVARAGNVNISGTAKFTVTGNITGTAADNKTEKIPCVLFAFDSKAGYPALTDDAKITVTGGEFSGEGAMVHANLADNDTNARISISGGKFSAEPKGYIASGCQYFTDDKTVAKAHKVTFSYGNDTNSFYVKDGNKLTALTAPTAPTGQEFDGWYTDNTYKTKYEFGQILTGDVDLYGQFVDITYTVTFVIGATKQQQTVKYGGVAQKIADPEDPIDGYKFGGWYTDQECNKKFDFTTKIYENTTLYAKWVAAETETKIDETTNGTVGNDISKEDKDAVTGVVENVAVSGVADAIDQGTAENIVAKAAKDAGTTVADTDKVEVVVTTKVEAVESDLSSGTMTLTIEPVATVKVNGTTLTKDGKAVEVPVENKDLETRGITVTVPLPKGFDLKEIKHIAADGTVEYFREKASGSVKAFTVKDGYVTFTITHFSTFEFTSDVTDHTEGYKDLNAKQWFHDYVDFAIREGLMKGYEDKTFRPENELTRAEMAQILYNNAGKPAVTAKSKFSDVTEKAWYHDAVVWASENGIVLGNGDGTFLPEDVVTREQIVEMLYRLEGKPQVEAALGEFKDADKISSYHVDAMKWAVKTGLVIGDNSQKLTPQNGAKRCEVATMLMRYFG